MPKNGISKKEISATNKFKNRRLPTMTSLEPIKYWVLGLGASQNRHIIFRHNFFLYILVNKSTHVINFGYSKIKKRIENQKNLLDLIKILKTSNMGQFICQIYIIKF
jgi:hypothetical protein